MIEPEFYPEPKNPENTITVPLEAFIAQMVAIRGVRALHTQWHFGGDYGVLCAHCSHAGNVCEVKVSWPCPTLQAFKPLDDLED